MFKVFSCSLKSQLQNLLNAITHFEGCVNSVLYDTFQQDYTVIATFENELSEEEEKMITQFC